MAQEPKRLDEFLSSALPPPQLPWFCAQCDTHVYEMVQSGTPHGLQWRCRRCLMPASRPAYPFDPAVTPDGKEEAVAALATLAAMVIGLRRADVDDLYDIIGPYFRAGWCVHDVHRAINAKPDGSPHDGDVGWEDRIPYEWLMYRVRRRLREWRWSEGGRSDDIMPGPWAEQRHMMQVSAERDRRRAREREDAWRELAARRACAPGEARAVAAAAARLARQVRAAGDLAERAPLLSRERRPPDDDQNRT